MNPDDLTAPTAKKARIEIIPLIDVIFFLLATFVLFTLSLEKLRSIEVPLPVAHPPTDSPDNILLIQTSEDGTFYWKEGRFDPAETVLAADLPARLAEYKARNPAPRVMIRGDRKAKFGAAILALDEVRKAGIKEVSIETTVSPTGN
jgi:biopolymer transport protein ExbD